MRQQPIVLGFQIAPMVDVLLVLLCFFIVTWTFARRENELDVTLPHAEHAEEKNSLLNSYVLNIKLDGTVILNQKVVDRGELETRLTRLSEANPDAAIIVRGDQGTPWRYIHAVVDLCQSAKIVNIAFASSKE